jgi:hypothetical protein
MQRRMQAGGAQVGVVRRAFVCDAMASIVDPIEGFSRYWTVAL